MTWSYDPSDLDDTTASGRLNVVRLLIGDTDSNDEQMQNEEINYSLSANDNSTYGAAIWCCTTLSSKYARLVNTELDGSLSQDYSDLSKSYKTLARDLERQKRQSSASLGLGVGGTTKIDLQQKRDSTTRTPNGVYSGQFDFDNKYGT